MSHIQTIKKNKMSPKCMPVIPVAVENLQAILYPMPISNHISKQSHSTTYSDIEDVFKDFVFECCEGVNVLYNRGGNITSRHDLYERYIVWSQDRGYKIIDIDIFMKMADTFFLLYRYKRKSYYLVDLR
jgi:hypothetical protein